MATNHTVKQGEHLSRIAAQYGFLDYNTIWNHSGNAALKEKRKSPHILYPGDRLVIPDKQVKAYSRATGKKHVFQVKKKKLAVRIKLQDASGRPIAQEKCGVAVETDEGQLTTNAEGLMKRGIPPTAENAQLRLGVYEAPVKIGHLDPVDEISGQVARLNNLGYRAGPLDGSDKDRLVSAVEEFQCDHELKLDGICGPRTRAKLKEMHGS